MEIFILCGFDLDGSPNLNIFPKNLRLALGVLAFAALIFSTCRALLLCLNPAYFSEIELFDILKTLLIGVRFDLAIIIFGLSPILLILVLPFKFLENRSALYLMGGSAWLVITGLTFLNLTDIAYFGEVKRHIGKDILHIGQDLAAIAEIAFSSRVLTTLGGLTGVAVLTLLWLRLVMQPIVGTAPSEAGTIARLGLCLMAFFVLLWAGRGMMLSGKPLDVIDAFSTGDEKLANLALNGPFVSLHEARRTTSTKPLNLLDDESFEALNTQHGSQAFMWRNSRIEERRPNVLLIMLESWSFRYIDALARNGYGVTPNFDRIVDQSQTWTRFYAAGQRSIVGIQASLTSVPILPTQPVLGYGLELKRISRIGDIAKQAGYSTLMMQSSNARSFHMDGIAKRLGFEHYHGKEDMPLRRKYPQDAPRFGWDYEAFMFLADRVSALPKDKPFFGFLFTGTTHEPFADPGAEFHKRPHDPGSENGFLNTLYYSDWALGEFIKRASAEPWFRDTIFVFTADHTLRSEGRNLPDDYHVPLVIYAPDGHLLPKQYTEVASQYDLLPTLLDLMNIPATISTFGDSLIDRNPQNPPYAIVGNGLLTGVIHVSGWHAINAIGGHVETSVRESPPDYDISQHAKWRMQAVDRALRENAWAPLEH